MPLEPEAEPPEGVQPPIQPEAEPTLPTLAPDPKAATGDQAEADLLTEGDPLAGTPSTDQTTPIALNNTPPAEAGAEAELPPPVMGPLT